MDEQKTQETAIPAWTPPPPPPKSNKKRNIIIASSIAVLLLIAGGLYYYLTLDKLRGMIVIPYISHQKPTIDPHLPSSTALSDKLEEIQFDGLFNISADASGVVYEDGLGELIGIDENNIVSVRLKTNKYWHDSYTATMEKDELKSIDKTREHLFSAADLNFTLRRIQALGSLSPDYILVSQAIDPLAFEGPDASNVIRMRFRGDRIWKETDIKEVLSFKVLPDGSDMNALNYTIGSNAFLMLPPKEGVSNYHKSPDGTANIASVMLSPFIDNSTFTTELKNNRINVLLDTPFGSLSPILNDSTKFFVKSNVSTTLFAVLFNTQRLNREQRLAVRSMLNGKQVISALYKVGTPQQRNIIDYRGNRNNYDDYVNKSVFPTSSYYVEDSVVTPFVTDMPVNMGILPDTVRIAACMNFGFREEYADLIDVINSPGISRGRLKVTAVQNDDVKRGNYDALLVAISGYRSNFLYDLYDIFLREPDLQTYRINLVTTPDGGGVSPASWKAEKNFFRLDAELGGPDQADINQLLQYIYGFMATRQIGDKQEFSRRIDALENQLSLGAWMFSLPSLAYFSTQFDSTSIDLYGVASQLSTIKKWKEQPK
ncbi:MAG: hypothetical protein KF749_07310 [Bacteroidetes bacterium]|nr:hypothetical protein [Bacteroidota bacterium]MCW5896580.1 hypothetical protein [Bacteroidota bacterium]